MSTIHVIAAAADISQIILIIGLYFAYRQLRISIKDMLSRARREAGSVAIGEAEKYAEEIIPALHKLNVAIGGFSSIQNKFDRFVPSEIQPVFLQKYRDKLEKIKKDEDLHMNLIIFANKIDSIAICFIKGIADETIVFESIGPAYCEMIEDLYFFYCYYRGIDVKNKRHLIGFENSILLYHKWKERIEKFGLEASKKELGLRRDEITEEETFLDKEIKKAEIKSLPIQPVGTF
jgi:hypothetical protein